MPAIPELEIAAASFVEVNGEADGAGAVVAHTGSNSYILTCEHVVRGQKKVRVVWRDGRKFLGVSATVERFDTALDLALLRTAKRVSAPAIEISDVEPDRYERVYGVGAGSGLHGLAFDGLLCAKNGSARVERVRSYVFTGVAVPGMSGGILANDDGELIGIITAVNRNGHLPVWSIGYAVSLPNIKTFLGGKFASKHKVAKISR